MIQSQKCNSTYQETEFLNETLANQYAWIRGHDEAKKKLV